MAVQMRTMLAVADNSGARKLQVILPLGGGLGKKAGLGDVVTAAVKEASPDGTIKKGKVVKAVIVRSGPRRRARATGADRSATRAQCGPSVSPCRFADRTPRGRST